MQNLQQTTLTKLFKLIEQLEALVEEADFVGASEEGVVQLKDALNNLYWAAHDLDS